MTILTKQASIDKINEKIFKDDREIVEITKGAVIYSDGTIEPFVPGAGYEGQLLDDSDFTNEQYRIIEKETRLPIGEVDIWLGVEGKLLWNKKGKKPRYLFSKESTKELDEMSEDENGNYEAGYNSKKYSESLDKVHDKLSLEARKELTEERRRLILMGKL